MEMQPLSGDPDSVVEDRQDDTKNEKQTESSPLLHKGRSTSSGIYK